MHQLPPHMPGAYSSFTASVCWLASGRDLVWCSDRMGSTSPFSSGLLPQQHQLLQPGLGGRGAGNQT